MHLRTLFAPAALAMLATIASAQTPPTPTPNPAATPGIDQRQARQEQRIDQGVASGQLTPRETRRLTREQGAIDKAESKAKADGTVNAQERHKLHEMQNKASRDIHRQKHDAQHVPKPGA
jgi:polyhydroxyalkanoate synthesis regulator phasin